MGNVDGHRKCPESVRKEWACTSRALETRVMTRLTSHERSCQFRGMDFEIDLARTNVRSIVSIANPEKEIIPFPAHHLHCFVPHEYCIMPTVNAAPR